MQEQQEKEAIRQLKAGNIDGLEFLYELHKKAVYGTAYGILHNHHWAEDVTQQVFIELVTAIKRYDLERPFVPWLRKIAFHKSLDGAKHGKGRDVPPESTIDPPSVDPSPEDEAERSERKAAIWNAVGKLKPKLRAVVVLRYYYGYRGKKMAQILDCPHVTVRVRLNTAHRRLREFLEPPDPPYAPVYPQPRSKGPRTGPSNGSLTESVLAVAKQVRRQIGAAGEQPVGREL